MASQTLSSDLEKVVFALCEDTDTPRALTVAILVRAKEYGELINLVVDPANYLTPERYYLDCVVTEFLRKNGSFVIEGVDPKRAALNSFMEAEKLCKKTNDRLAPFLNNGPFEDPNELRLFESIERMQRWIAWVLGPIPTSLEVARHGPGSTFRDIKHYTTVLDKMSNRPTLTQECVSFFPLWERTWWARAYLETNPHRSAPEIIRGNRFTSVYKNAKTERGICIEGSINIYFQLGVGGEIRRRFKRMLGWELETAQDVHRRKAMIASRTGTECTIDLKMASDLNALNTTRVLLAKSDWLPLLESLRSPFTQVKGKWHRQEKFSSMGNGYTFELETLIFMACAMEACYLCNAPSVIGEDICVFGDDIILPVKAGATVLTLLKFFGFQSNPDKTFLSGPFRESCGGDFFDGKAVRPHYVKKEPNDPASWISMANGIRRLGRHDSSFGFRCSIYWRAWLRALDAIPIDKRRIRGPEDLGDLVIHDEPEFWQSRRTPEQKRFIRTWSPVHKVLDLKHWNSTIVFAGALYGIPSSGVIPRKRGELQVEGYRKRWVQIVG